MITRRRWLAAGRGQPAVAWRDVLQRQSKPLGVRPQQAPWLEPRNATRYTEP